MYPHGRSLVKKYDNRPFVIIGVNSDQDRAKLKERIQEENITWRSFWAGSTGGPIPKRWNVTGWPTIYVLDAKGIIRAKNVRGPQLDTWIEKLVQEAEAAETKQ
ncbi:MAG: TlpA disulfide reductase family protein [Planctomycetota bacterium]